MNKLSPTQAAYLAGLIDGEGCISYRMEKDSRPIDGPKRYPSLKVDITNTNEELIRWTEAIVGDGYVYHAKAYQNQNHKTRWSITWKSNKAIALLGAILPYLTIKKSRAELMLELHSKTLEALSGRQTFSNQGPPEWLLQEREKAVAAMSEFNKKGVN